MKKAVFSVLLFPSIATSFAFADEGAANCEKGDMSSAVVRQSGLIGKWKQVGIEDEGKVKALKLDLVHEFTNDCRMIASSGGEPSAYKYALEGNVLILTSQLTGSNYYKEFTKAEENRIIHGGDVFDRIK